MRRRSTRRTCWTQRPSFVGDNAKDNTGRHAGFVKLFNDKRLREFAWLSSVSFEFDLDSDLRELYAHLAPTDYK